MRWVIAGVLLLALGGCAASQPRSQSLLNAARPEPATDAEAVAAFGAWNAAARMLAETAGHVLQTVEAPDEPEFCADGIDLEVFPALWPEGPHAEWYSRQIWDRVDEEVSQLLDSYVAVARRRIGELSFYPEYDASDLGGDRAVGSETDLAFYRRHWRPSDADWVLYPALLDRLTALALDGDADGAIEVAERLSLMPLARMRLSAESLGGVAAGLPLDRSQRERVLRMLLAPVPRDADGRPGLDRFSVERPEDAAWIHAARIALAAEAFRADHGRVPEEAGELVPAYLESWPVDPVWGEPFVYRRSDEVRGWTACDSVRHDIIGPGYTVYSLGEDGRDQNGRSPWTDSFLFIRIPKPGDKAYFGPGPVPLAWELQRQR